MTFKDLPSCFRLAKEISEYSEHHQHKIGATIYLKGKPIAVGYNQRKSHPMMSHKKTLHAELAAILSVRNKSRLKGATMVTYREQRNGNTGMARPCESCEQILKSYGINRWIYTTYAGFAEEVIK